jgi:hypothetical protein
MAPVQYYSKLVSMQEGVIDLDEHFRKQTYRNRAVIYDANGALKLIIPLKKHAEKTPVRDILISYDAPWQDLHWKSIESAYRSSPFFEYYEDEFANFYVDQRYKYLSEYNLDIQAVILKLLKINPILSFSSGYEPAPENWRDYRDLISPKKGILSDPDFILKPYPQVFEPKHGFLPNMSIIDLLFNEGPHASDYLSGKL